MTEFTEEFESEYTTSWVDAGGKSYGKTFTVVGVSPAPPKQYGWICPACGCGNAPYSTRCGHCVPRVEGTTGSTK